MKKWLPGLINALSDSISLILAGLCGYFIRTSGLFPEVEYVQNPGQYGLLLAVSLLIWHLISFAGGGYRQKPTIFKIDELLFHFKASIMLLFVLMAMTFLYKGYDYSRLVLFFSWISLIFLGNILRQGAYRLKGSLHRRGIATRKASIIGDSENISFLRSRIQNNPACGLALIDKPESQTIGDFVEQTAIDELFLVSNQISYDEIWGLREKSLEKSMRIHLVPSLGNFYLRNLQGLFFDGTVLISLDSLHDKGLTLKMKRIFDFLFALFWLIVLSPAFLLIALLIKIDSSGPVVFRQMRVGLNGKLFEILKFRTMSIDSPAYAETPRMQNDPRITRVGAFLRATGLDELPQLLNVIKGEMSIVGPRPEMPFIVEKYSELEKKRLKAKPGITGLWQVYARSENLPIHHHIEYDLYYIENFSLLLDLIIILDTIPTAVLKTGI